MHLVELLLADHDVANLDHLPIFLGTSYPLFQLQHIIEHEFDIYFGHGC